MTEHNFNYEDLADEQVAELSAEGDKDAAEYLLAKYKNLAKKD